MTGYRVVDAAGSILVEEFEAANAASAKRLLDTNHPELKLGRSAHLRFRKGNDWYDVDGRGTVTKA
ncbi:hypothetical protein RN2511_035960 [Rhodococcus sp. NKCM2511]|nr:hypothetical protein RN2511_035960 [Rhodococcus sp. NKCM2511]